MLQSRALAIALILLLSTTLPEVHSKFTSDKDRRDWLVTVDAIAIYIYESVSKVSPKIGQILADAAQTTPVVVTRNFFIRETAKITIMVDQVIEKMKNLCYKNFVGY
ncbi:Apovitellenin-1 [Colius striatus]|uniref:Apovitellenin-1 n=1 Tax=Colius striatus TaxID=57412 RepID=A0A091JYB9_COLST|nr:apovitellenin-1 [Colius striatus]KFP29755.1 Apovitellenin-1 [Colius striatus]